MIQYFIWNNRNISSIPYNFFSFSIYRSWNCYCFIQKLCFFQQHFRETIFCFYFEIFGWWKKNSKIFTYVREIGVFYQYWCINAVDSIDNLKNMEKNRVLQHHRWQYKWWRSFSLAIFFLIDYTFWKWHVCKRWIHQFNRWSLRSSMT